MSVKSAEQHSNVLSESIAPHWTMAQLGAREHYAPARAAAKAGRLNRLYTDVWASANTPIGRKLFSLVPRLGSRWHPELADATVCTLGLGVAWASNRRTPSETIPEMYSHFQQVGGIFSKAVAKQLHAQAKQRESLAPGGFFSFTTTALEALKAARELSMTTVVSQIDPARIEDALVAQEAEKWPGWETRRGAVPQSYWNRLEEEWSCADAVLVNSEWSKAALVEQGVASEKLFTVPLAFEPQVFCEPSLGRARGPLRVLFLGQVNLRKGFPYLVEAARLLKSTAVVIDVVGPTSIASPILRGLPDNIRFHGPVDRRAASGWYRQADVFVLPTISDGFALTQLEAMAHGVPVITTERCGDVVDHGVDGWRLAAADASAIADLLDSLATHPETLVDMSHSAQMKSRQFTLARYLRGLDTIWGRIMVRAAQL